MSRARLFCLALIAPLLASVLGLAPAGAAQLYFVSGKVLGADLQPVVGATVTVRDLANQYMWFTKTTNSQGDFGVLFPETTAATVQIEVDVSQEGSAVALKVLTDPFQVSGQRNEVITLQSLRDLQTKVVLGQDGPTVPNAAVTASGSSADLPTLSGLNTRMTISDQTCRTGLDGMCVLRVLAGGAVDGFEVDPAEGFNVSYPGLRTSGPEPLAKTLVLPDRHAVSGVVIDADGSPVSGATVSLTNSTATATTTTAADGSYTVSLNPSSARLRVRGVVRHADNDVPFDLRTDPFDLDRPLTVSLSTPALATLRVLVRDALDHAVTDAAVTMNINASAVSGTATNGTRFSITIHPADVPRAACVTTDSNGACDLPIFLDGDSAGFDVQHPIGGQLSIAGTTGQPGAVREVYARYPRYASIPSAGSVPGSFVVTTAGATIQTLSTSAITVPSGVTAPLGRIDSNLLSTSGGSSTGLRVRLPAGVIANAVFEVGPAGQLTDVTDLVELSSDVLYVVRQDGGYRDADGVVNQQVVGAIVPAQVDNPLRITTTRVPAVPQGKPFAFDLSATGLGAPYTWQLVDSMLPSGLSLSSDGVISGTTNDLGRFSVVVGVRNSFGRLVKATFEVVSSPVVITTWEVPDAYQGGSYSTKLERAGGGTFATWRVDSGALPPGMTLTRGGTLSGRPTSLGRYSFEVTVTSGGKTSPPQALTIVVRPMEVATESLPAGTVGRWYSQQLTTHGGKGTLTWSLVSGSLPPKLKLGSGGRITGTPSTRGTWTFTVRVTDSSVPRQEATRTLTLTVG